MKDIFLYGETVNKLDNSSYLFCHGQNIKSSANVLKVTDRNKERNRDSLPHSTTHNYKFGITKFHCKCKFLYDTELH